MGYCDYMKKLLKPLGVYDLSAGSYNEAELQVLGNALDDCCDEVEAMEQECVVPTAEDYGLDMYESILPDTFRGTVQERRNAIIAMISMSNLFPTVELMNRALLGCGIEATVSETGESFQVLVSFPETYDGDEDLDLLKKRIESILPCHLEIIYDE